MTQTIERSQVAHEQVTQVGVDEMAQAEQLARLESSEVVDNVVEEEEVEIKAARCKAGFVVCFNAAAETCLMCGRTFCSEHGKVEQGVCRHCRREYSTKLRVEEASYRETIRREVAEARNAVGLCGVEGCENAHIVMCERCGENYCARHWGRYSYRYHYRSRTGINTRKVQVILCASCKHNMQF